MESIFDKSTLASYKTRIEQLTPESQPDWGKMSVSEMLAHCSLVFEYNNGQRQAKVNPIMRFLLKRMMKTAIIGKSAYKQSSPTAPYFKVVNHEKFELEKARLLTNLQKYSDDGPDVAASRKHVWLGELSAEDWSWAMIKHLDHHLKQFGV